MAKPKRKPKADDQADAINALVDRIIAAATVRLEEQIAELRAMRDTRAAQ